MRFVIFMVCIIVFGLEGVFVRVLGVLGIEECWLLLFFFIGVFFCFEVRRFCCL